jgi:curved DNA-binding protein CbpA
MVDDLYTRLGVSKSASKEEIGKAYRSAARTHHPDKGGDAETWHGIAEAYEVLRDPETRARYDETGEMPQRGPSIEDEARSVLIARFAEMVTSGSILQIDDVAAHLRTGVGRLRSKCLKAIAAHEHVVAKLGAQLGRLTGSEAPFFEAYLNEQITSARRVIEEEQHGVEISDQALKMIEDLTDQQSKPGKGSALKDLDRVIDEMKRKRGGGDFNFTW